MALKAHTDGRRHLIFLGIRHLLLGKSVFGFKVLITSTIRINSQITSSRSLYMQKASIPSLSHVKKPSLACKLSTRLYHLLKRASGSSSRGPQWIIDYQSIGEVVGLEAQDHTTDLADMSLECLTRDMWTVPKYLYSQSLVPCSPFCCNSVAA